ncbi:MAG TPA: biopolymer transporter ExbD [Flavobacterium sp.]|jgi:biopolymer transport protein ExbD
MAELNAGNQSGTSKSRKIRSTKLNSKVDLTAMVDLAFLLITFFMLTTTLGKENSMQLVVPDSKGAPMPVDENRTMTIQIDDNNKAKCFMGKQSATPNELTLGTRELRDELARRKKEVLAYSTSHGKPEQGLIVLIKPGKESNYGNLVDVLDEMAISRISSYTIVDTDKKETALLEK